jgi:hypothetical protein
METVGIMQGLDHGLPELTGLIRARKWFTRQVDDIALILEAIAIHDNRLDV